MKWLAAALAALALSGCEAGQSLQTNRSISKGIIKVVEPMCREYGGISNIMLLQDATDDGIVTCADGRHNFPFDA